MSWPYDDVSETPVDLPEMLTALAGQSSTAKSPDEVRAILSQVRDMGLSPKMTAEDTSEKTRLEAERNAIFDQYKQSLEGKGSTGQTLAKLAMLALPAIAAPFLAKRAGAGVSPVAGALAGIGGVGQGFELQDELKRKKAQESATLKAKLNEMQLSPLLEKQKQVTEFEGKMGTEAIKSMFKGKGAGASSRTLSPEDALIMTSTDPNRKQVAEEWIAAHPGEPVPEWIFKNVSQASAEEKAQKRLGDVNTETLSRLSDIYDGLKAVEEGKQRTLPGEALNWMKKAIIQTSPKKAGVVSSWAPETLFVTQIGNASLAMTREIQGARPSDIDLQMIIGSMPLLTDSAQLGKAKFQFLKLTREMLDKSKQPGGMSETDEQYFTKAKNDMLQTLGLPSVNARMGVGVPSSSSVSSQSSSSSNAIDSLAKDLGL